MDTKEVKKGGGSGPGVGIGIALLAGAVLFGLSKSGSNGGGGNGGGGGGGGAGQDINSNASFSISFYDSLGNQILSHSPYPFNEGENISVEIKVKNESTKGGQPYPDTFTFNIAAYTDNGDTNIPLKSMSHSFAPGETYTFSGISFRSSVGDGGKHGNIVASVQDVDGNTIAQGDHDYDVVSVRTGYAGSFIFYDQNNVIGPNDILQVSEGQTANIRVAVKNESTRGGVPWPATMTFNLMASSGKKTYTPITSWTYNFAAGETATFSQVLPTNLGDGPDQGNILVSLQDSSGNTITNDIRYFALQYLAIIHKASIFFQ